jgi:hypothetical protein
MFRRLAQARITELESDAQSYGLAVFDSAALRSARALGSPGIFKRLLSGCSIVPSIWISWISLGLVIGAVTAHGQIQFEAEVDRTRSGQADPITYTLKIASVKALDHVPGPQLNLKDFDVQGPSIGTQSNSTYVNGRFSTTFVRTLTYTLLPRRTGNLTIGSARLKFGDKVYATRAFDIRVSQGSRFSEKLFLRLEQDPDTVYVGQQVTLDYDLCYNLRLHNVGFTELPSFEGFWVKELFTAQQLQTHREMINGVAFNVASLRRVALFPTSAGVYRTDPLVISCDIPSG